MLGMDQPVKLQLLEITPAMKALEGVMMELDDCAFPLLESMDASDDPNETFSGSTHCSLGHGLADQGWNGKICSKPMRRFFLFKDRRLITMLQILCGCSLWVILPIPIA